GHDRTSRAAAQNRDRKEAHLDAGAMLHAPHITPDRRRDRRVYLGLMRRLAEAEKHDPSPTRSPSPQAESLSTIWVKPATRETIYRRTKETGELILVLIDRLARQELARQESSRIAKANE
ncbi:MAG: hypothetical protein U1A28_04060, partial [Patescibacteria group bacterium]|nr:hypothetical protein [Patescibacteria group bacterium]